MAIPLSVKSGTVPYPRKSHHSTHSCLRRQLGPQGIWQHKEKGHGRREALLLGSMLLSCGCPGDDGLCVQGVVLSDSMLSFRISWLGFFMVLHSLTPCHGPSKLLRGTALALLDGLTACLIQRDKS